MIPDSVRDAARRAAEETYRQRTGLSVHAQDNHMADHHVYVYADAAAEAVWRESLLIACRALRAESEAYREKWCNRLAVDTNWDKGYAQGVEAAAHSVANAVDRGHFDKIAGGGDG